MCHCWFFVFLSSFEFSDKPFIAHYRKEVTGGLDDAQLRLLAERLHALRELEKRRAAIITAIEKLGKMTPPLLDALTHTADKAHLEDLYLPYRKKRRTKAQITHQAGLQPLADSLLNDPRLDPWAEAAKYLKAPFATEEGDNPGVADAATALEGAQHILLGRFTEHAPLLQTLRDYLRAHGVLTAKAAKDKKDSDTKYTDYHEYSEAIGKIPSHRALALLRGEREGVLKLKLLLDSELEDKSRNLTLNPCESQIARTFNIRDQKRAADAWLIDTVRTAWRTKIFAHLETESMGNLQENAEAEAIWVFAQNLKALLLAPSAGARVTIGLDPGLRTARYSMHWSRHCGRGERSRD